MTESPDDQKTLADKLALWCVSVDTRDLKRLPEVFSEDVEWEFGEGTVDVGLDSVVARIRAHLFEDSFCGATQHGLSNTRIDIEGDEAESHAYFCAVHAGIGDYEGEILVQWGIYHDFWLRTESGWRIRKRNYQITISDGPLEIVYAGVPENFWREGDKRRLPSE